MKKTIPFKKKLTFKTNISEITSISLENTLHKNERTVEGNLIITGTYKITDTSIQVDKFEFEIPINIEIDEKYDTKNIIIDIADFYYEIINNNILEVNIEILMDNIVEKTKEKPLEKRTLESTRLEQNQQETEKKENHIKQSNIQELKEERCIEEENEIQIPQIEIKKEQEKQIKNIIEELGDDTEEYITYYVYIIREGDNIDTILAKYNTTKEQLEEYNDLKEIKIGDKIIIPEKINARNK